VLRELLGLGWVIAAVAAGLLLLGAGGWFVRAQLGPPRPPFVQATTLAEVEAASVAWVEADEEAVLVVRAGGRVRAFQAPDAAVIYCPASGHLEGADGTVWALDGGRLSVHGEPLAALPVEIYRDTVYVDPTTVLYERAPGDGVATPVCDPPPA
jgi:nitrite reductase/ring-hydroxylating ferredoxin subunit